MTLEFYSLNIHNPTKLKWINRIAATASSRLIKTGAY